ncbi:hypothetical protein Efla_001424 [Eimeria flavescens]
MELRAYQISRIGRALKGGNFFAIARVALRTPDWQRRGTHKRLLLVLRKNQGTKVGISCNSSNEVASKYFKLMAAELQDELDAARQHLHRFERLFRGVDAASESQTDGASSSASPATDPMKVRPVSPQVEREVEAAREAHVENDDFDDW